MAWKVITSISPYFKETVESMKKSFWISDSAVFFLNPEAKKDIISNFFDSPVVPMSSISVSCKEDILNLLATRNEFAHLSNLLGPIEPDIEYRLNLTFIMSVIEDDDLEAGLCAFQIDAEARRPTGKKRIFEGIWSGSRSVYLDKPLSECYEWFRRLEKEITNCFPRATFNNHVGLCSDCGTTLKLKEHDVTVFFLCNNCKEQRATQDEERDKKKRFEESIKRREKKLKIIKIFTPEQILIYPNSALSKALYIAYQGKCQYCLIPETLPKEQIIVEHIIPRFLPLEMVPKKLIELGISKDQVANFCASFLPPHHNSVLNLIPACLKYNVEKKADLLHPATLEFMLRKAKHKAKKVLEIYSQELNRNPKERV